MSLDTTGFFNWKKYKVSNKLGKKQGEPNMKNNTGSLDGSLIADHIT